MLFLGYQLASRVNVGSVHEAVPTRKRDCRDALMPPSFAAVTDAVDELFTLPPSEFTAARNALVKQLRADKQREAADEVKALRRPNLPAWALNQVARSDPEGIAGVLEAGAAVVSAQRRALSGVRDSGLREASQRRREAIDDVWRKVASVLRDAGAEPQAHRQAVAATLEAASLDPAVAQVVTAGRLTVDVPPPSGFGDVAGFSLVAPAEGDSEQPSEADTGDDGADHAAAQAAAQARRHAEQARRRADELVDRAAEARRTAVRTADEAARLEQRAAQTRARAEEESAHADELSEQADRAQSEAEQAAAEAARLAEARP